MTEPATFVSGVSLRAKRPVLLGKPNRARG
jgi:hypothetical protein